jgi:3-oxo-5-alpha-steroid 4-dehydrogenase 1
MMLDASYQASLTVGVLLALGVMFGAWFVPSPYGRFSSRRLGPVLPPKLGWVLMELPAPVAFFFTWSAGASNNTVLAMLVAGVWVVHYGNRGFYNPLRMRVRPGGEMSITVVLAGMGVTALHGYLYGRWVSQLAPHTGLAAVLEPVSLVGWSLYVLGFVLNVDSDHRLHRLRDPMPDGTPAPRYSIPQGGGFRWVSSPHYLGEILAWTGLMVATGCPGGLFVWLITIGNLVPRASQTHAWYRDRFPDYPAQRRALVPFLW